MCQNLADLYRLDVPTLTELERMGKKSADNLVQAIEASKHRTLDRFITGLTIHHVGTRMAEIIAGRVKTIDQYGRCRSRSSRRSRGWADRRGQHPRAISRTPKTRLFLDDLAAVGVSPEPLQPPEARGGKLVFAGKTFVLTGTLRSDLGRKPRR